MSDPQSNKAAKPEVSMKKKDGDHYTFRMKKRDVHGLAALGAIWFLWSQGGELARMFRNLVDALS